MKKLISLVVCVSLLFSQPAQANFLTDLFGGLFTVVSYPFQLILGSTNAPFFKKQNPFIEKDWEKEAKVVEREKRLMTNSRAIVKDSFEEDYKNNPSVAAAVEKRAEKRNAEIVEGLIRHIFNINNVLNAEQPFFIPPLFNINNVLNAEQPFFIPPLFNINNVLNAGQLFLIRHIFNINNVLNAGQLFLIRHIFNINNVLNAGQLFLIRHIFNINNVFNAGQPFFIPPLFNINNGI